MSAQRLDWEDLRIALAISDEGSLSAAARKLGVNHATVFRRLKAMECNIGVRLFERMPDGYVPTAAGEEAIALARRFADEITDLERRIIGHDLRPSGVVRITTIDSLLFEVLPPILKRFHEKEPDITIELVSSAAMANLSKRDADIALRATTSPPETLIGRRIATIVSCLYASPAYLASAPPLDDLAVHDWIGYDESLSHLKASKWQAKLLDGRMPVVRANAVLTIKYLVAQGVGLGAMPCMMGDAYPGLVRISEPNRDWDSQLWLLTHPDLRHVARVRAVMDFLGDELVRLRPLFEGQQPRAV